MRAAIVGCMFLASLAAGGCATSIKPAEPGRTSIAHWSDASGPVAGVAAPESIPTTATAVAPSTLSGSVSHRVSPKAVGQTDAGTTPGREFVAGDNIRDVFRENRRPREARIDLGVHRFALGLEDRIYQRTRIRFSASYTMVYQHAFDGSGPRDALGSDLDVVAGWAPVGRKGRNQGGLEMKLQGRYKIGTEIAPSGLSTTIDSLWPTVDGFGIEPFSLTQLYWSQDLLGDRLRVLFGNLSPYSTFFGNRINSSSLFFFNYAFSDNPAVFFPGNGLGLHVIYNFSSRWTLAVGVQNANGIKTEIDPSTVEQGEFWYAAEVDFSPHIRGLGPGTYRLGAWSVDPREQAGTGGGQGFVISIDQQFAKRLIGFLRYEFQGAGLVTREVDLQSLTGTKQALRFGVGFEGPIPALPHDYLGVGLAWGEPSDSPAEDSYIGEIFYRTQLTDSSHLTVGLQAIQSSTIFDQVAVFSARYRFEF